jgi:hypothetical protein
MPIKYKMSHGSLMSTKKNESNLLTAAENISEKRIRWESCFWTKKFSTIDGIYNSQNDHIWAINRAKPDPKVDPRQKPQFPQKVMVWLRFCYEGVSPLVIFEKRTVDHARYIKEVLPVALKFANDTFGNHWTFQLDDAKPHIHAKSQD